MTTFGETARMPRRAIVGREAMPWRPLVSLALLALLAAIGLIGPRLIGRPFLVSLIETRLCPELRIECRVAGPLHVRLLPYPVIEAEGVTLVAPERKLAASAVGVVAELRALPLLLGRISIDHLDLSRASIDIAAPPGGMRLFASADGAGTALMDAVIAADRQGDRLTRISLDQSRIQLRSESGRHDVVAEQLSGIAAWPQGGGELFAHFSGFVAGEAADLRVEGPDLSDLTHTEGSPLSVRMIFGENRLSYRGRLVKAPDLVAAGVLDAASPSAKRLVKTLRGLKWPSWLPDAGLHIAGGAFVTARGIDFENADFAIWRSRFSGGMSLRMAADGRPSLSGTVATPLMELGDLSFLRPEEIALPSFGRLPDLDLRMSARRIELGGRSIDAVAAGLIVADRRLDLTLSQSSSDETGAKLHLVATPDEEGVTVKLQASSEMLDVGTFLSGFSIDSGLTGMGGFTLSLEGHGEDLARLERSLAGKASRQMKKGALSIGLGADPPSIVPADGVPGGPQPSAAAGPMSRRFSEASFSAVAEHGVLALTQGRIGEGAGRIVVGGKLDLADRSVDLSLASAGEASAEPAWRLRVTGPWSAPKSWRAPPVGK